MARKGTVVEDQMKELLKRMGFENALPKKEDGNDWSSKELLDLLDKYTIDRLPGMMKFVNQGLLEQQNPHYILDRGYKVDWLFYSPKLQGYMMVDFMSYPMDEDWSELQNKRKSILDLYKSGIYNILNIKRAGVLLVEPEEDKDVISESLEEEQEDTVYCFLSQLEENKSFLTSTFTIDLRQHWGGLALPPE